MYTLCSVRPVPGKEGGVSGLFGQIRISQNPSHVTPALVSLHPALNFFLADAFFLTSAKLSAVLNLETEINPLSTLHKPPKILSEEMRSKWQIEVVFQKLMLIHEAVMRKGKSLLRIVLTEGKGSVCISFEE